MKPVYLLLVITSSSCITMGREFPLTTPHQSESRYSADEQEGRGPKKPVGHAPLNARLWKKTYTEMTFDELQEAIQQPIADKNWPVVVKYFRQMEKKAPDLSALIDASLHLADTLFEIENYKEAEEVYHKFVLCYPKHHKAEYCGWREIDAGYRQSLVPTKDQTKTEDIIDRANSFLRTYPQSEYQQQIIELRTACYQKLFESECSICNNYILYNRSAAAQKRFTYIQKLAEQEPALHELFTAFEHTYREQGGTVPSTTVIAAASDTHSKETESIALTNEKESRPT